MSSGASTSDPFARALALGRTVLSRARERFLALSRPARVMFVSTIAMAALIVGYVGYRSNETTWAVLFSNLDREDAAAVLTKLKERKVPYRVEGDGGTIEVPSSAARELRLELAGAGLPRGGGVGFESFDKMRLGATEFEQRVLYRRALEGELSRTIDTIAAVQSSRVHLVLPERSVFVGRAEPASASIVLKLRPGRALGGGEVAGVVHLVSSSVGALAPERVTVVTTDGAVLHKPRGDGDAAGDGEDQASAARTYESNLEERVRAMLEKVVGRGMVDVRVSAELDRSRVERVEDRYDPQRSALRSEQSNVERAVADRSVTGVPGAESNLPEGAGRVDGGAPDATVREAYTRNFELDHVVEKRLVTGATLRRLTVAVAVDDGRAGGAPGRSPEEVERLNALVRSAVGADERRGDVVTVTTVPFVVVQEDEVVVAPPSALDVVPERYRRWVPVAAAATGLATTLVVVLTLALKARRRRRAAATAAAAANVAKAVVVSEDVDDDMAKAVDPEELRARAHARAEDDPATAALVLRFWLGEGTAALDEGKGPSSGIQVA